MVSLKSSMGEISSKISSSPDRVLTSVRPAANCSSTFRIHVSLPISQL